MSQKRTKIPNRYDGDCCILFQICVELMPNTRVHSAFTRTHIVFTYKYFCMIFNTINVSFCAKIKNNMLTLTNMCSIHTYIHNVYRIHFVFGAHLVGMAISQFQQNCICDVIRQHRHRSICLLLLLLLAEALTCSKNNQPK